jgi:hypothetical protein
MALTVLDVVWPRAVLFGTQTAVVIHLKTPGERLFGRRIRALTRRRPRCASSKESPMRDMGMLSVRARSTCFTQRRWLAPRRRAPVESAWSPFLPYRLPGINNVNGYEQPAWRTRVPPSRISCSSRRPQTLYRHLLPLRRRAGCGLLACLLRSPIAACTRSASRQGGAPRIVKT